MGVVVNSKKQIPDFKESGVKVIRIKPLTADEMILLIKKARAEKSPAKRRKIIDEIVNGFYGEKVVQIRKCRKSREKTSQGL
jgi:hypothetical protein